MSAPLLQIEGLSVRVEDKEILHGIDLQIKKGETHVLMGPNGAGKTTTISMITGITEPTMGEIKINNIDINKIFAEKFSL